MQGVAGPDSGCDSSCFTLKVLHRSVLYEGIRHKNATYRHLQWYSSCCLLRRVAVPSSAVSDISNPCWKGAFIVFYLWIWDTHVMSAWSIRVKAPACRHLQCYSYCCLVNLLHCITVNLPVICGIDRFELVLEGRQVTLRIRAIQAQCTVRITAI